MLKQKIKLAQNDADVINDLIESDAKLNELNDELNTLTQDYASNIGGVQESFFSFQNVYFWFVIVGLIILAASLVFLLVELKKPRKPKEKVDKIKFDSNKEVKINNIRRVERDYEAEEKAAKKKKGPVKIKVLKVK